MLSPRWRKVLRDLWSNTTRTALVVLSIAVGVFAIGMIAGSQAIIMRDLSQGYLATNPASASLFTEAFDDDLVQVVRHMPGVADAEARRTITARIKVGPEEWKDVQLIAIPDYDDMRINTVRLIDGARPPARREVLFERASTAFVKASVGASVVIKTFDGKERELRVSGQIHDPGQCPALFCQTGFGYISLDTAEWLGESRDFNQLNIVVADQVLDKEHIKVVTAQVQDKIEKSGRKVSGTNIPEPQKHPVDSAVQALILLLGVLGFFTLLLSGFLVVNTVGALLTQQTRQIGVMKSIGARSRDITGMYLVTVLAFGLLSLLVAVPLGALGARAFADFNAGLFNFDITSYGVSASVLTLQVGAGVIVPLLAALLPIFRGTRITVREAIGGYGLGKGRFGKSWIDRLLERVRGLSRPMLLALRNTFRRKGRLALTLTTLTLAGAIFIAVVSVRESVALTLQNFFRTYNTDVLAITGRSYRTAQLDQALGVPGVVSAESWSSYTGRRLRADDSESNNVNVQSLPAKTKVLNPTVIAGRWLLPEDASAVVVNTAFLKEEPDVKVGDQIVLKVAGQKMTMRVVGVVRLLLDQSGVYVNQSYFSRVVHEVGKANQLWITTERHDGAFQLQVAKALQSQFERQGLQVVRVISMEDNRAGAQSQFDIIIVLLLIMAVLLAVVGGLGLMGTMSINVIERTREIGVMRAIGASNGAVLQVVMAEGILIGALSWCLGALAALPISKLMSDAVGMAFIQTPFSFTFSLAGLLIWLAVVVVLAALASFLPAWNASRLTVRDVLAYE
jgi:putative ABC transport system permease protein